MSPAETGMATRRSGIFVVVVIFVCFAAICTRIIHPMLFVPFFASKASTPNSPPDHPHYADHGGCGHHKDPMACTQGREQLFQPKQVPPVPPAQTREKGLWASLLPLYSVGVIAFLVYTLAKMMLKDRDANRSDEKRQESYGCMSSMTDSELQKLREQLVDTEEAMLRLLQNMENGDIRLEAISSRFQDTLGGLKELTETAARKLVAQNADQTADRSAQSNINTLVDELSKVLHQIRCCKGEKSDEAIVNDAQASGVTESKKSV